MAGAALLLVAALFATGLAPATVVAVVCLPGVVERAPGVVERAPGVVERALLAGALVGLAPAVPEADGFVAAADGAPTLPVSPEDFVKLGFPKSWQPGWKPPPAAEPRVSGRASGAAAPAPTAAPAATRTSERIAESTAGPNERMTRVSVEIAAELQEMSQAAQQEFSIPKIPTVAANERLTTTDHEMRNLSA